MLKSYSMCIVESGIKRLKKRFSSVNDHKAIRCCTSFLILARQNTDKTLDASYNRFFLKHIYLISFIKASLFTINLQLISIYVFRGL